MKGKFGLKIHNYSAAVLYEYGKGIRDRLSYTKAMLPNSLLLDHLKTIGLKIHKESATRDVICIKFDFGCLSYEDEIKKLSKKIESCNTEEEIEFYTKLIDRAEKNKELFEELTADQLREKFYVDGITIDYGNQKIKYKFLFRSAGKAKVSEAMFINQKLYDKAVNFLHLGLTLPKENAPIVELQAYASLAASSIIDRIHIDPSEILVLKDVDSVFHTNVISIEIDEEKHCIAKNIDNYELKNTLFDGQALIDDSIFPSYAEGYILLRHHFCKMAAFHTNIQLFFQDYFGDEYETATVKDMWGNEILVKNIKLITTDNAMKWIKFNVSYQYWSEKIIEANNAHFGIVKTAHESKLGKVQKMSYQMINALNLASMDSVIKTSKEYIKELKTNDEVFIDYLEHNVNYANDFEVLIALYRHNPKIVQSDYFRERRKKIIYNYVLDFKNGKVLQNADNLVIVGSPYAELLHSVGEDPLQDPTFSTEEGAIQVYTERFEDGEFLASFRSPFNSQNNLCHLHNHYDDKLKRYFHIGRQCIAVNLNGTDFQARNNGSDQDSDSIYTTNHFAIVEWAKECVKKFPTIENRIPKETNHYSNTFKDMATVDSKLAAANMAIGQSSNLAQLSLTYSFNFSDEKYLYYTCILAVLAQVAIDNAKRAYDIDLVGEIKRIKQELDIKENGLPLFWFYIKRKGKFSKSNSDKNMMNGFNPSLVCPMNYLCEMNFPRYRSSLPTINFAEYVNKKKGKQIERRSKRVEALIERYSIDCFNDLMEDGEYDMLLFASELENVIEDIRRVYISKDYQPLMVWLIKRAFKMNDKAQNLTSKSQLYRNRPLLMKVLYETNREVFLSCFKTESELCV